MQVCHRHDWCDTVMPGHGSGLDCRASCAGLGAENFARAAGAGATDLAATFGAVLGDTFGETATAAFFGSGFAALGWVSSLAVAAVLALAFGAGFFVTLTAALVTGFFAAPAVGFPDLGAGFFAVWRSWFWRPSWGPLFRHGLCLIGQVLLFDFAVTKVFSDNFNPTPGKWNRAGEFTTTCRGKGRRKQFL